MSYVERRGPRFKAMLGSVVVAFVTSEMQQDDQAGASQDSMSCVATGAAFAQAWGRVGVLEGELDLSRRDEPLREIDFS